MPRQHWGRRIDFFLTSVGLSVGVGDLWRFPYLVMKNGGGAFLIPVIVTNIFGAMPVVYLEMIMGQYSQSGAIPAWNVCPLLKGSGYGAVIASFLYAIYNAVIIGWLLFYLIHSFFPTLPWTTCNNAWNIEETCIENSAAIIKTGTGIGNLTTTTIFPTTFLTEIVSNLTESNYSHPVAKETSAEQFWKNKAMDLSEGSQDIGSINWAMFGCLFAIEIVCFLCIFKGVKLTGKVVYFTVLGPFVLLAVFIVRGATLPGAIVGIRYYITRTLKNLKIQGDAVLLCLLDLVTGFFCGFVVFSVLGHVSYRTGISIENFNQSGKDSRVVYFFSRGGAE